MPDLSFFCAVCGNGMTIAPGFAGQLAECSACHRIVPVPALLTHPHGSAGCMEVFPPTVLSVDVEFRCEKCATKMSIDARWHGRSVNCPACAVETRVPLWWNEPAPPAIVQLSGAEIEFLSGLADAPARAGAA